ncbi:hypothetical protein M569_14294 [Genlisea aurea]|uniref:GrpE protein homolog n=1 Tax=Genlisea aurea TaxID=192259 RepID=S8C7Z3_9LAMI|nr:hypothetical protein M569_14294 [Genlisea aurea]
MAAASTNLGVSGHLTLSDYFRRRKPFSRIDFPSSSKGSASIRRKIRFVASSSNQVLDFSIRFRKFSGERIPQLISRQAEARLNSDESMSIKLSAYRNAISAGADESTIIHLQHQISTIETDRTSLALKLSSLSSQISDERRSRIRLQADFDEYRKISEKEASKLRSDARREVIRRMLSIADSFERARGETKAETEAEKRIEGSYRGIYKQFVEVMRSFDVAAVPAGAGKRFDPSVHEAVAREESTELKEGAIIQELRRGFFLGERLLRPAKVKVSSGPHAAAAAAAAGTRSASSMGA